MTILVDYPGFNILMYFFIRVITPAILTKPIMVIMTAVAKITLNLIILFPIFLYLFCRERKENLVHRVDLGQNSHSSIRPSYLKT